MDFLPFSHSPLLVAMAILVSVVSGFTGLSLTRDLSSKAVFEKKVSIALASVTLGGGIWAMHFIGMLGLQLPILFFYDAAVTLISALTAILIVGAALILLHFTERTPVIMTSAGGVLGCGILTMHYIGMAGLEMCQAVYTPLGFVVSSLLAISLCILAIWVAYGHRTNRNIILGTLCFAAAVCSVHFLAMSGTQFIELPRLTDFGPRMSNATLALGVIVFSFIIFGACLWVSVTYLVNATEAETTSLATDPVTEKELPVVSARPPMLQVPCERDGGKVFITPAEILFVRADGHYTQVYTAHERLFCAWPITAAAKRLITSGFIQTHRSYLVNPAHVVRFERSKDKGVCLFESDEAPQAPVSRSKLRAVQDSLASQVGAIHEP